jgi:hypothetical protein
MKLKGLVSLSVLLSALLYAGCKSSIENLADAAARGETAYRQYKTADYTTAKAALLDYINYLDRLAETDPTLKEMLMSDAMVSYVRLAKLEEKNRGSEGARYMTEAASRCGKLRIKWGNCAAETLRTKVDAIDTVPAK